MKYWFWIDWMSEGNSALGRVIDWCFFVWIGISGMLGWEGSFFKPCILLNYLIVFILVQTICVV